MSKLIKIAFIVPKISNSAPIIYVYNIVSYIIDHCDVELFYFDNVIEIDFPCKTTRIKLFKKYDFNKFDIVHSHGLRPDLFIFLNSFSKRIKKISTIHSYIEYDLKSTYNVYYSLIFSRLWFHYLSKMDFIVTLTNNMNEYYTNKIHHNNIQTILSGHSIQINNDFTDFHNINHIQDLKKNFTLLGIIANLTEQKGVDQIIKALPLDTDFALLIVGDGKYKKNLTQLVNKLNLNNRVFFLGKKNNAYNYLKFIDIYILSSYQEGFGLSGLEAAQYKVPILCSDIPVFKEIYPLDSVIFFTLNNAETIINGLRILKNNHYYYSKKIFNLYLNNYTTTIMCNNYLEFYKKIIY
jgi:hypothetical protein